MPCLSLYSMSTVSATYMIFDVIKLARMPFESCLCIRALDEKINHVHEHLYQLDGMCTAYCILRVMNNGYR
ncbi:hypothetical protein L210DRAFT_2897833 [Boletus edulis BED1]|uniref:Uncharacterized protein n=1 Tax=Boletus edulis BED1 TaxID=1328754 RepID=A0AAD4BA25_BOLED|nr:hypothetical protein L210DRAFT_2897833 [Boletus edulis BED1]